MKGKWTEMDLKTINAIAFVNEHVSYLMKFDSLINKKEDRKLRQAIKITKKAIEKFLEKL